MCVRRADGEAIHPWTTLPLRSDRGIALAVSSDGSLEIGENSCGGAVDCVPTGTIDRIDPGGRLLDPRVEESVRIRIEARDGGYATLGVASDIGTISVYRPDRSLRWRERASASTELIALAPGGRLLFVDEVGARIVMPAGTPAGATSPGSWPTSVTTCPRRRRRRRPRKRPDCSGTRHAADLDEPAAAGRRRPLPSRAGA
jgi:hypothetical protein